MPQIQICCYQLSYVSQKRIDYSKFHLREVEPYSQLVVHSSSSTVQPPEMIEYSKITHSPVTLNIEETTTTTQTDSNMKTTTYSNTENTTSTQSEIDSSLRESSLSYSHCEANSVGTLFHGSSLATSPDSSSTDTNCSRNCTIRTLCFSTVEKAIVDVPTHDTIHTVWGYYQRPETFSDNRSK